MPSFGGAPVQHAISIKYLTDETGLSRQDGGHGGMADGHPRRDRPGIGRSRLAAPWPILASIRHSRGNIAIPLLLRR